MLCVAVSGCKKACMAGAEKSFIGGDITDNRWRLHAEGHTRDQNPSPWAASA